MTSQSRVKIYARERQLQLFSIPHGDPAYDWSEAVFLHYLSRRSRHRPQPPPSGTVYAQTEPSAGLVEAQIDHLASWAQDHLVPKADDSGVWWWDTSLPLSLAESRECEELFYRGLTHHPIYKSLFIKCTDDNHAGNVFLGDQVTMLLNLVCNTVLGGREDLCCS